MTLDPVTADLLRVLRDVLEADGNRHLVLGVLDGLIDEDAKPEDAVRLLHEHTRKELTP